MLIVNVNVVDVEQQLIHKNQQILIKDGLIASITESGVEPRRTQNIFDAQGAYATPGLYDAHVHIDTSARIEMMLPENIRGHRLHQQKPMMIWFRIWPMELPVLLYSQGMIRF